MNPEETGVMHDLSWAQQPQAWPWWIWAVLGGCLVLALTAAAFFFWKRKSKQTTPPKPLIPAHITALEALRLLEARLDEEKDLEFVVEVSRILRVYIQDRFQLRAPHRSTEEFLWEASESSHLSFEYQVLLGEFLKTCDRVKFARQHVLLEEMKKLFSTARSFVIETAEKTGTKTPGPAPAKGVAV